VLANEDEDDPRVSLSVDFALTAPRAGDGDAPPEYLAPHPGQWEAVPEGEAIGEDGRA
jgi:hypothetical protein